MFCRNISVCRADRVTKAAAEVWRAVLAHISRSAEMAAAGAAAPSTPAAAGKKDPLLKLVAGCVAGSIEATIM